MRLLLVSVVMLMGKNPFQTQEFLVYPNPAHDFFTITIPVDFEHCTIDVFDPKGKIVYTNPFISKGETKINCKDWVSALYIVAIQVDDIRKRYKLIKD